MRAESLTVLAPAILLLAECGGEGEPPDDAARRAAERADAEWWAAELNILGPPLEASAGNVRVEGGNNKASEPANSGQGNTSQDPASSRST